MARLPKLKAYAIADPDPETLGPAMLALTPIRKRFARGFVAAGGKNLAEIARAAGYSDVADGAKVRAQQCVNDPKVIAAIREEASRTFDLKAVQAMHALSELVEESQDEKVRLSAAGMILDRTGFGPRSTQNITVTHEDNRSTAELLAEIRKLAGPRLALPVIEGQCEEVPQ